MDKKVGDDVSDYSQLNKRQKDLLFEKLNSQGKSLDLFDWKELLLEKMQFTNPNLVNGLKLMDLEENYML